MTKIWLWKFFKRCPLVFLHLRKHKWYLFKLCQPWRIFCITIANIDAVLFHFVFNLSSFFRNRFCRPVKKHDGRIYHRFSFSSQAVITKRHDARIYLIFIFSPQAGMTKKWKYLWNQYWKKWLSVGIIWWHSRKWNFSILRFPFPPISLDPCPNFFWSGRELK